LKTSVLDSIQAGAADDARLRRMRDGRWRLEGDLTLAAVAELAGQMPTPGAGGLVELDLSTVGRASSAGVALLLEWQAVLQAGDARLVLRGVPPALRRLAALANVDGLLGLDREARPIATTDDDAGGREPPDPAPLR
jgi:phospholipid transport system transporter-binding protein